MGGLSRQDAWSEEDDLLLAEIVLRHVREGSTQLKAFEEASEKLSRTAAACGFRWNACLRSNYEAALELAKQQRQKKDENPIEANVPTDHREKEDEKWVDGIEKTIAFLQELSQELNEKNDNSVTVLVQEKNTLEKEVQSLEGELETMKRDYERLKEDYKKLIDVMDKARALTEHSLPYLQEKQARMEESG
ncbi:RsfA family transcriptional regulator [Aliibacillus thermotolerans]|uniref:RsfA family transcriptional regulator n=1 Tax=Aliibacillus thermotolerans TaxID=1834418 RepID=A0ABW0U4Y9_9BACI|nr:RsfA family transcriptional regulator [Aliibacillus thermotolerans]MDA3131015.1 RsfA family transcriptional regulator [Aliibacillus thermotolerans]